MASHISVENASSFATESKSAALIAKAAEVFPLSLYLSDDSHSSRLVLKHVQKQMQRIVIAGERSCVSSCNAICEMRGSVNELEIEADHLSVLPNDVIDQLVMKINERLEVNNSSSPSDEIAYNEKLDYLRRIASSFGRPEIHEV